MEDTRRAFVAGAPSMVSAYSWISARVACRIPRPRTRRWAMNLAVSAMYAARVLGDFWDSQSPTRCSSKLAPEWSCLWVMAVAAGMIEVMFSLGGRGRKGFLSPIIHP